MEVRVGPPTVTIHDDDQFVVCQQNAELNSDEEQGYFVADTRLVSGYRMRIARVRAVVCNSAAVAPHSSRFEFTNPTILGANGEEIPERCLHVRLDRTVGKGVHEDYDVTSYARCPVEFDLEISIESDFADLFDVKSHRTIRRGMLNSTWNQRRGQLVTHYENDEFHRELTLQVKNADSRAKFVNGGLLFRVALEPGQAWHTCLLWQPTGGLGKKGLRSSPCSNLVGKTERDDRKREWVAQATRYDTSDPAITETVRQAVEDLASMRMHRHDGDASTKRAHSRGEDIDAWVPAAGVPWFVSLFGRDALTVSLQALSLSPRFALGSLHALGQLQADDYDDDRDMQPGKIEHEVRHGELAALRLIPHTPYYGSHEATTLYVLLAADAWRWHGDRDELDALVPSVERALSWIDTDGDLDGDGLQEYQPRGPHGYYNQGWKDSGDAILDRAGKLADHPIALCEHQGMVVAAKRAWAGVLKSVYGDAKGARRLRSQADRLADAIETRFWWAEESTYYLGLDGNKEPLASVTSNPGLLLWQRVVEPERAALVARRLLAPDMWSGWGIRTLSADHVAYNPFSYQLGSVWPHDNAFAAAGFRAYDLNTEANQVAAAIFDAANRFASHRLPELFAGLDRDEAGFPVQYLGANVPQAWASGAVVHLIAVMLGLEADAPNGVLRLRPALPEWLPEIRLAQLSVGDASVDFCVTRRADGSHELAIEDQRGDLEVILAPS